ncbi:MAG: PaaI family thioesterase [Pseudomonadales bacterium]
MTIVSKMKGFNRHIGVQIESIEEGEAVLYIDLAPEHLNSGHIVHGGALATLLDSACGAAAFSVLPQGKFAPTTNMSVAYMNAVGEGRITAKSRILKRGSKMLHCEAEVFQDDLLLAKAQTSFTIIDRRKPLNVETTEGFEG